jgi:hypothetical protein
MSDKLQLVVKAGNTYLAQTEMPTFLHPLEVASYQPRDKLKLVEQPHPECPTSFSLSSRLGILILRKLRYGRSCIL